MVQTDVSRRAAFIAGYTDGYDITNTGTTTLVPPSRSPYYTQGRRYGHDAWLAESDRRYSGVGARAGY